MFIVRVEYSSVFQFQVLLHSSIFVQDDFVRFDWTVFAIVVDIKHPPTSKFASRFGFVWLAVATARSNAKSG